MRSISNPEIEMLVSNQTREIIHSACIDFDGPPFQTRALYRVPYHEFLTRGCWMGIGLNYYE